MKISLRNIGKVKEADVEINGITVIAGENNTGKSTVGKALFSVFNSFYNIDTQILSEKVESISNVINALYGNATKRFAGFFDSKSIAEQIINNYNNKLENFDTESIILKFFSDYVDNFEKKTTPENMELTVNNINELLTISDDDFFKSILQKRLISEFNEQINNIYSNTQGSLSIVVKGNEIKILVIDNEVESVNNKINLLTETIYIDDPYILDELGLGYFYRSNLVLDHRSHLKHKVYSSEKKINIMEEIVAKNRLEQVLQSINTVCDGDVIRKTRSTFGYKTPGSDKLLDVKNLSAGLKSFVIIKKLLIDNVIEFNGTIILDEPEIHLHPEWQLVFAELIVLLQKEFNLHVLLNTHSPYFLRAIEVYSEKHKIYDKCNFYLAENVDNVSIIKKVNDNLELIYKKLSYPLQNLEDIRYEDE